MVVHSQALWAHTWLAALGAVVALALVCAVDRAESEDGWRQLGPPAVAALAAAMAALLRKDGLLLAAAASDGGTDGAGQPGFTLAPRLSSGSVGSSGHGRDRHRAGQRAVGRSPGPGRSCRRWPRGRGHCLGGHRVRPRSARGAADAVTGRRGRRRAGRHAPRCSGRGPRDHGGCGLVLVPASSGRWPRVGGRRRRGVARTGRGRTIRPGRPPGRLAGDRPGDRGLAANLIAARRASRARVLLPRAWLSSW